MPIWKIIKGTSGRGRGLGRKLVVCALRTITYQYIGSSVEII